MNTGLKGAINSRGIKKTGPDGPVSSVTQSA
jgi:hypothetical protein